MKIIVTTSFEESCKLVGGRILDVVKAKPTAKIGLATGSTVIGVYQTMIDACKSGQADFSRVSTVNLDEYLGLSADNDQSYRYFMDSNLFNHINIDKNNTFVARGTNPPSSELGVFSQKVYENGGIDIQLLGMGVSGHIAFNESSDKLTASAHVETLNDDTIEANSRFFEKREDVPTQAYTMGMADIFSAKSIVLLAAGANKIETMKKFLMNDYIDTRVPASLLKLHHDATIYIDQQMADAIGYKA